MSLLSIVTLLVLPSLAVALPAPNALPSTMTALEKSLSVLPCFEPFNCVKEYQATTPTPAKDQVLVKVAGSSINPCEVDYLEYDIGCSGGGGTLGMDLAGVVVAVGSDCKRLKIGDKVWADTGEVKGSTGAMAQYATVSEQQTGLAPSTLSLTEAGTIPLVGFTALEMWQKIWAAYGSDSHMKGNLTVVVTSGSGGTGFMALQLAKRVYGASSVVTATSGVDNIAFCKAMGADVVIDYHKEDVIASLPDDSVDIVLDNHGAKGTADASMRVLRSGGVYLVLPGGDGGKISSHPKAGVKQINFGIASAINHTQLDILKSHFEAGKLKPHVFTQFPLSNASAAFALSKAGHVTGKISVVVDAELN